MNKSLGFLVIWPVFWLTILMAQAVASERADQYQDQDQNQKQSQDVTVNTGATALSTEDNSNISFNTSNESHNTVMIPNNNTEGCLRVFGIGFPTSEGAVVLGIPWRSQTCDLKDASKDAFAQGNLALGWMLKCKMKAMKKAFGSEANCLSQTVEAVDMQGEIDRLQGNIQLLLDERSIDHRKCEESKDRIFEACVAK